jgi:N4-gp56 family major capsid protein
MAKTSFATTDNLTKKVWEEKLFRDTVKESYFSRFMGTGSESMCQEKTVLTKQKGDNITFGIRMRLSGAGVTSGTTLEGNEEDLTRYDFNISLEQYRHAVRDEGALDRQRAMFSIDDESRSALKDWGTEKIDQLCFDALTATAPSRVFYASTSTATEATAISALTTSNLLEPGIMSRAKAWAKTGGNRAQTPVRPIKIKGKEYYVLLVHPDQLADLFEDSAFQQARREAEIRGGENPIFTGAKAIYNGFIIHDHENVPIALTGGAGSDVPYAKSFLLGAQALCWAWGMRPEIVARDFDYGNEHGYAWGMISGVAKPRFNSLDYGCIGIYTARTRISDAA